MRALKEAEDRKMMEMLVASAAEVSSSSDDDDDDIVAPVSQVPSKKKNKKKKKKPKKKPVVAAVVAAEESVENTKNEEETKEKQAEPAKKDPVKQQTSNQKKKKKKSNNKRSEMSEKQRRDADFDKLLNEFAPAVSSVKQPPSAAAVTSAKEMAQSKGVLRVDPTKLDYRVDLKNLFGAAVAKSLTKQKRGASVRTVIARGEADWPAPRAMVSFRVLGTQADDGATVYGIEWSTHYAAAEAEVRIRKDVIFMLGGCFIYISPPSFWIVLLRINQIRWSCCFNATVITAGLCCSLQICRTSPVNTNKQQKCWSVLFFSLKAVLVRLFDSTTLMSVFRLHIVKTRHYW